MSLDEIRNVKLKKVKTRVGRTVTEQIIKDESEQTKLMDKVSFKKYYPLIEPYTFRSVEFELSDDEIDMLVSEGKKVRGDHSYVDWKQNEVLIEVAKKIEHHVYEVLKSEAGFIRFNTLSPKDGIFAEPFRMKNLLEEAMEKVDQLQVDFKSDFNKKIYALYIASTNGMMVKQGMDGIRLLVHSKRTLHELEKFRCGELKTRPHMIVREFAHFDVQYEFRAFIYKKKYCCLSQYNPYCFFPVLHQRKNEIEQMVRKFLDEKVIGDERIISLENLIVDVVIVGDDVKIVELNPYGEFCGSCLFDWSIGEDFQILTGRGDFEFRIMEQVPALVKHRLEKNWLRVLGEDVE